MSENVTVAVVVDMRASSPSSYTIVEPGEEAKGRCSASIGGLDNNPRVAVMPEKEVDAYLRGVFGPDYEQHKRGEADE